MYQFYRALGDLCKQHEDRWWLKVYQKAFKNENLPASMTREYSSIEQEGLSLRISLSQHH